jgi:protein SCO1
MQSLNRQNARAGGRRPVPMTLILIALTALAACRSPRPEGAERRYELKGKVVSFDRQKHKVTIRHEEIPGYMEGMTMPFTLKDEWVYDELAAGADIQATLVVHSGLSWLENPVITKASLERVGPGVKETAAEPVPGAEVPDLPLVNQDGRRIGLRQYPGRAVLLTFIYTRCPLPDYCPLMTSHFAAVDRALQASPDLYPKTHLLSVSVDPAYDTPQVLRGYGLKFVGPKGRPAFDRWEFATGTAEEVKAVAQFFGLSYWPEADQIIHSLRTALISPDGKVVKVYRGNEWQPDEVLKDLARIARG